MGDSGMIMVLLLGGGVFMCSLCAAGGFLLYQNNPDLFGGVFGAGQESDGGGGGAEVISSSAGKYACPKAYTLPDGTEIKFKYDARNPNNGSRQDGVKGFMRKWCTSETWNTVLASRLPADAQSGEIFDFRTLQRRGGIYGPKIFGFDPNNPPSTDTNVYKPFQYRAP